MQEQVDVPSADFPLHLVRPYLVLADSFPRDMLDDFVRRFAPVLLVLGDGIFVDAHSLRRSFGSSLKVERSLNEYQFAQLVIEDFNPSDFSLFAVFRLSEFGEWKEDVLMNTERAMESHCKLSGNPTVVSLVVDSRMIPDRMRRVFRCTIDLRSVRNAVTALSLNW